MPTILARLVPASYQPLPYFIERIPAGFPSPASGYMEASIDLNDLLIDHPHATFLVRVEGLSMIDMGIYPDDLLVVDRSLEAKDGDIIVCSIFGEFTVKELCCEPTPKLIAHNPDFPDIDITDESDFEVFGVVTNTIRNIKRNKHKR